MSKFKVGDVIFPIKNSKRHMKILAIDSDRVFVEDAVSNLRAEHYRKSYPKLELSDNKRYNGMSPIRVERRYKIASRKVKDTKIARKVYGNRIIKVVGNDLIVAMS